MKRNFVHLFVLPAALLALTLGPGARSQAAVVIVSGPVATDDTYSATENSPLTVPAVNGVLANDTDADGDTLTAVQLTNPAHGSATLNPDGSFTYTPDATFDGADSFTYQASDGTDYSSVATVTINVADDQPSVSVSLTPHAAPKVGDALTATAIVTDLNEPVTLTYVWTDQNSNVLQTTSATSSLTDTYTGTKSKGETITVTVTPYDGKVYGNSAGDGVTIANTPPAASGDTYSATENSPLTVPAVNGVLANDTDADGDTLTAVQLTNPAHGSATLNPDGSFTYTPATSYFGQDSFTYQATDGTANSNVVTVTLNVAEAAAPILRYIDPIGVDAQTGHPDMVLKVVGLGVQPGAVVHFGNLTLTPTPSQDGQTLTVTIPGSLLTKAASYVVYITDADGQSSNAVSFIVSSYRLAQFQATSAGGGPNIYGGTTGYGLLVLSAQAQTPVTVALAGNNFAACPIPATETVPAGANQVSFPFTPNPVAVNTPVTLTAKYNGVTLTSKIMIYAPTVTSAGLSPSKVKGGQSVTLTVNLSAPAPANYPVKLTSSKASAFTSFPATLSVPAGATTATLTLTTKPASATANVSVSATANGATKSATVTITH